MVHPGLFYICYAIIWWRCIFDAYHLWNLLYSSYKDEIINDLRLIASKTITTKTKQKEFSNKLSSIYPLNKDIIDYFTKFLIRKIYVVDNDYLLYEFIDDTLYRYELGTWSIKENRKINRKRREFKNKDYWGKKPKED